MLSINDFDVDKRYLRRICKAAGLSRVTCQNLRATPSTLLKEWGVPEKVVRAAMGHEADDVAEAHYDSIDPTNARPAQTWDREAGENFADLFARLCPEPESHHLVGESRKGPENQGRRWRSQGESNPCLRLERAAS